ncbi:uncharacterized protein LOC142334357 isoform X2 [Lycorma delicatula]
MAESTEKSGKILNKIKELFGEKYPSDEGYSPSQTDSEHSTRHKLHRQLSRSRSGRLKHKTRIYSAVADINYFPPTKEDENSGRIIEHFKNETQNIEITNLEKDKVKTELNKDSTSDTEISKTDSD